jgi:ATP-dependent phosphofructokinase / diphosphate-dependent phosphofructokinase
MKTGDCRNRGGEDALRAFHFFGEVGKMAKIERVGILTGGGDCPGLNAVIRAIVVRGIRKYSYKMLGIQNGWAGLLDYEWTNLTRDTVSGIVHRGGTILGTSRTNPMKSEATKSLAIDNYKKLRLDALIAIGGDDTLGAAGKLSSEGLHIIGIPKTIDNDVAGTDYTFGFNTAVEIATEAIDRLHTTAEAHHRVIVVEVMGRNAGWIATFSGMAGGADMVLIPEDPFDLEDIVKAVNARRERGKTFSIIVIAEGAFPKGRKELYLQSDKVDEFGHIHLGGVANYLARDLEKLTGMDVRTTILGHIQRGGTPSAWDRVLGTRYGVAAVDMVAAEKWGHMAALRGFNVEAIPIVEGVAQNKTVPPEIYDVAKNFFG